MGFVALRDWDRDVVEFSLEVEVLTILDDLPQLGSIGEITRNDRPFRLVLSVTALSLRELILVYSIVDHS